MLSRQTWRWIGIGIWAELGILGIAFGILAQHFIGLVAGLNLLAVAAFLTVMDHEARGRGE